MHKPKEAKLKERINKQKVVTVTGSPIVIQWLMVEAIQEAVLEGYRVPPANARRRNDIMFNGRKFQVVMYKDGYEVPTEEQEEAKSLVNIKEIDKEVEAAKKRYAGVKDNFEKHLEELAPLRAKQDLLDFASNLNIKVPEDKKVPRAIKSHLVCVLESYRGK